jgi:hypothetical protein
MVRPITLKPVVVFTTTVVQHDAGSKTSNAQTPTTHQPRLMHPTILT